MCFEGCMKWLHQSCCWSLSAIVENHARKLLFNLEAMRQWFHFLNVLSVVVHFILEKHQWNSAHPARSQAHLETDASFLLDETVDLFCHSKTFHFSLWCLLLLSHHKWKMWCESTLKHTNQSKFCIDAFIFQRLMRILHSVSLFAIWVKQKQTKLCPFLFNLWHSLPRSKRKLTFWSN